MLAGEDESGFETSLAEVSITNSQRSHKLFHTHSRLL